MYIFVLQLSRKTEDNITNLHNLHVSDQNSLLRTSWHLIIEGGKFELHFL
jgi:hypothetical protein